MLLRGEAILLPNGEYLQISALEVRSEALGDDLASCVQNYSVPLLFFRKG